MKTNLSSGRDGKPAGQIGKQPDAGCLQSSWQSDKKASAGCHIPARKNSRETAAAVSAESAAKSAYMPSGCLSPGRSDSLNSVPVSQKQGGKGAVRFAEVKIDYVTVFGVPMRGQRFPVRDEDARHVELLVPMTNERVCFSKTEVAS